MLLLVVLAWAIFWVWITIRGVILFSITSALCMGVVWKRTKKPEDTAIGILWAMGMAIGIYTHRIDTGICARQVWLSIRQYSNSPYI